MEYVIYLLIMEKFRHCTHENGYLMVYFFFLVVFFEA